MNNPAISRENTLSQSYIRRIGRKKGGIDLRNLSRWLILSILLVSVASLVTPAHAQVSISLNWTSINAPPSGFVTNTVIITNNDPVNAHTIQLALVGVGYWGWESFVPNPVVVPPLASVASTLTIPIPGPDSYCPGESSHGPFTWQLTVQGSEGGIVLAQASLVVYLMPVTYALTVNVEPTKQSYIVGEMVTLKMDTNMLGAQYFLKVRKPDGTVWASVSATLPATFTKKATEPLGTYTAELMAYYCGVAQDTASFSVTPDTYSVTISLFGVPTDVTTGLYVDSNKIADMKGGDVKDLSYPIGTSHTFQVDQYVTGAEGYRYYCASNTWTASTMGSNVFKYEKQVRLEVSTDPAGITDVTASGWFAVGASMSISAVPSEVQGTEGTKYAFSTWTVDGTPRAGNGFIVVMDAPHKVVAKYDTMFLLTVRSDFGNPTGGGYYVSGSTATFSVNSPVGIGVQQVFVEWKGDYTGKEPKGSITMDGPKTVTAVWTTSYTQLYVIAGVIAVIAVVAVVLLLRRRRAGPSAIKPPPPPPPPSEVPESVEEPPSTTPETETVPKREVSVAIRCTNCGHELKTGQIYCPECGQKQTD